jgi:hypothetical protein
VKAVRKIWSTEYKSYQLPDEQQEKGQELDEFDRWRQKVYSQRPKQLNVINSLINELINGQLNQLNGGLY